jgi:hypothetical protein
MKAIVAKEHPLLIFRDLFDLDNRTQDELTVEQLIERGKTYGLEHMPKLLWVTTGERLPDLKLFETLRQTRNSIQHFCAPSIKGDLRSIARQFIYRNLDPLLKKHFGLCAIEFHQDHDIGYDYLVECLVLNELPFSVPSDFRILEIDFEAALQKTSKAYQAQLAERFKASQLDLQNFRKC